MMKVVMADAMGMCFGVRDALEVMRGVEVPVEVTVLGELVHNPVVTRELERRGFFSRKNEMESDFGPVESDSGGLGDDFSGAKRDKNRKKGPVLITAHGVSDRFRASLGDRPVIDTTCPLVRKAHAAAVKLAQEGYFVVVVGRRGHVEVAGLTGDLDVGRFVVVERVEEVCTYDHMKIGVMAQTTSVAGEVGKIVARIREKNPGSDVRWVDTICQPTKDRQAAVAALAGRVDVVVVVGGRGSNNTRELVRGVEAAGVRAVHVEEAGELREGEFLPWEVVGVTAGTSTLSETVLEVKGRLEGFWTGGFTTESQRAQRTHRGDDDGEEPRMDADERGYDDDD